MGIDTDSLHHAYLLVGERIAGERLVSSVLDKLGLREAGNPDLHIYRTESLDVDTAREISLKAIEKPFGDKKIFLISADRFTSSAQNALLKTIEDPRSRVHFFVVVREEGLILPTLLSRMQIVVVGNTEDADDSPQRFLELPMSRRLDFAKEFADQERSLPVFMDSLLEHLRSKESSHHIVRSVFALRRFSSDPAVSPRMILEHLALVLK